MELLSGDILSVPEVALKVETDAITGLTSEFREQVIASRYTRTPPAAAFACTLLTTPRIV